MHSEYTVLNTSKVQARFTRARGWFCRSRAVVPKMVAAPQDVGLQHESPTTFWGNRLIKARFMTRSRVSDEEHLEASA